MFRVNGLILVLFSLPLCAQSDRGTITGRVLDPSSAAVPNAAVVATGQATGVHYRATTNQAGNYLISQLPVDRYEVSVEAAGFRRYVRKEIGVNVAQTVAVDVTLEVGQVEQTVEVSAAAGVIDAATSDVGTVISRERIMDLPLAVSGNMRNPEGFIFLAPGVTGDATNTQINGSQSRAKEVLLDGVGSTSPESGGLLFTYPSVEAIGEFKLVSSNFSAEYGRTGGGFEVFTTRSGANAFHGSLFDYLRNDVFDARGFFAPTTPVNRQNEFGGALGGPVLFPKLYNGENKTFFHFVYGGFRYRAGAINDTVSIPSQEFRRGDFSRLVDRNNQPIQIYDPATTRALGGVTVRDPFGGNQIPASRFSQVSQKIVPLYPAPSNSGLLNNFLTVGAQKFSRDQINVKIDHALSDRNRLSGFVYIGTQNNVDPERLPNPLTNSLNRDRRSRWIRLTHDLVLSPSMLNHFSAGYTREGEFWRKLSAEQGWPEKIGLKGVATGQGSAFPRLTFTDGFTTIADDSKTVGSQVNNAVQLSDSLGKVRGNHSFKAGAEVRWLQTNGADWFGSQGQFSFNALETGLPGRAGTGNAFASLLVGAVDNASQNILLIVPGNRYRYLATYFQDDWKATRRLTLNWGLRYEIYFPRTEAHDNLSGFDPALPNPGAGNRPGAVAFLGNGPGRNGRRSFADTYYKNFGPRFGFALQTDAMTVLRGGYGIYYAPGNATAGLRSSQSFGFGFNAAPSFASTDNGVTPGFYWDNGFPQNFARPPFIDPTVANRSDVNLMGRGDGRPPYFQNWSMGVQRELPGRVLLEAAYVGTKGTRLGTALISLNQVDPKQLALGALLSRPVSSPEAQAAGVALPYAGFTGSVAQALRPYPQYLGISSRSNPNGNSTYHSLQAKAEKRLSRGLTYLVSYTWSKTISDGDIQAGGGPGGQDYYNRRLEKAISTNDVPHAVSVAYRYELPFGPGKPFATSGPLSRILGGWAFTGIHQYQSGKPVAISANNTLPLFNGVLRPDVVAGADRKPGFDTFDPGRDRYINPAAFQAPAALRFGTAARSYADVRGFPLLNESFGAVKRTTIGENFVLIFRGEFFNAFNRVVFVSPASNVSAANFGRVSGQSNTPRQGLLALRLEF